MTMTEEELTTAIDAALEDCDGIDPYSAIVMIADALDVDVIRTLLKIKYGRSLDRDEVIIFDLIDMSQSNKMRSINQLIRAAVADDMISKL